MSINAFRLHAKKMLILSYRMVSLKTSGPAVRKFTFLCRLTTSPPWLRTWVSSTCTTSAPWTLRSVATRVDRQDAARPEVHAARSGGAWRGRARLDTGTRHKLAKLPQECLECGIILLLDQKLLPLSKLFVLSFHLQIPHISESVFLFLICESDFTST